MTEVGLGLSDYEIVIAHRISSKESPHPIIAQLVGQDTKAKVFKVPQRLKNKFNSKLTDDMSLESVKARRALKPIVFEAKRLSNQTKKYQARLQDDKLLLSGQFYMIGSLDKLLRKSQPIWHARITRLDRPSCGRKTGLRLSIQCPGSQERTSFKTENNR